MSKQPTPVEAAKRFDAVLREWLTPAEYRAVLCMNRTAAYADGVCASHDYCDANMAMAEALGEFAGDDLLWAAAWNEWRQATRKPAVTYVVVRERMERNRGCYWFAIDAVYEGGSRVRVADAIDTKEEAREMVKQMKGAKR